MENNDKIYVSHMYSYLEDSSAKTYHSLNPPLKAGWCKSFHLFWNSFQNCSDNSKLLLQIYLWQQEILMTDCLSYFWTDQSVSIWKINYLVFSSYFYKISVQVVRQQEWQVFPTLENQCTDTVAIQVKWSFCKDCLWKSLVSFFWSMSFTSTWQSKQF